MRKRQERFNPSEKECASCRQTKAAEEFGKDRRKPDGLKSYCRFCENQYVQSRYRQRPPSVETVARHKQRNKERDETRNGLCSRCDTPAEPGKKKCTEHLREAVKAVQKAAANRYAAGLCERCGKRPHVAGFKRCQPCLDGHKKYYSENRHRIAKPSKEHANKIAKARYSRIRLIVWDAYGGRFCACCGEDIPEFLTIEHENGDGAAHRKEILGSRVASMVAWLYSELLKGRKHPGLKVFCYNCNAGAWRNGGICPHQTLKQQVLIPLSS